MKDGDYDDEEDDYGESNAEGGLTGPDSANGAGGGGGEVDLLSMDELTVSDTPRAVPPVAGVAVGVGADMMAPAAPAAAAVGMGGMVDLFGGGGGTPVPQPAPKQVGCCPSAPSSLILALLPSALFRSCLVRRYSFPPPVACFALLCCAWLPSRPFCSFPV